MENLCPCCEKHCPQNDLHCHRGKDHFGVNDDTKIHRSDHLKNPEEKSLMLLRKCGHFLHHNAGHDGSTDSLMNVLTAEERKTLEKLLEKCLNNWNNQSRY